MKRVGATDQAVIFLLGSGERDALVHLLQAYPVTPPAHHTVSKALKEPQVVEYQRLLDEALAEQRAANKRRLEAWLAAPERFQSAEIGYHLTLERADCEWLLQVLNDIRVGNWLRLGSPESGELAPLKVDPRLLPAWLAMEMTGYLQMVILVALES